VRQIQADYATLEHTVEAAALTATAAELHGGLCGALCAGGCGATATWVEDCLRHSEADDAAKDAARDQLRRTGLEAWHELAGPELGFYPLLPDDDAPLDSRVAALAAWCDGFLTGIGLAGVPLPSAESAAAADGDSVREAGVQVAEILTDFAEIGRAGLSTAERNDEVEADFALAELIEYVRVSVQLAFDQLEAARTTAAEPPATLH